LAVSDGAASRLGPRIPGTYGDSNRSLAPWAHMLSSKIHLLI
jgi:hypothetical protein